MKFIKIFFLNPLERLKRSKNFQEKSFNQKFTLPVLYPMYNSSRADSWFDYENALLAFQCNSVCKQRN